MTPAEIRRHLAWLEAEAAAGRVTGQEREQAYWQRVLRRLDVLNAIAAYTALLAMGVTLATTNVIPALVAAVALFGLSHLQESKAA